MMKPFEVNIPLRKFIELGGELTHDQELICIDHYPCKFISKRMKTYKDTNSVSHEKILNYKVEMLDNSLYPKGKILDCYENELNVSLMVKPI